MSKLPLIIAHRGASAAYPENTLPAFDAALAEGVDGIELDLQLSADGVPVVFHDDRLDKLGRPRERISEHNLAQLQALDVGRWFGDRHAGARMPTLDEVLAAYANRTRLYLEIKNTEGVRGGARHRELARTVVRRVLNYPHARDIAVLSFHGSALATVHEHAPMLACVRNVAHPLELVTVPAQASRLAGISIDIDRFASPWARLLKWFNKPLYAYTCDSRPALRRALALGIDHVITNRPDRSRRWLQDSIGASLVK